MEMSNISRIGAGIFSQPELKCGALALIMLLGACAGRPPVPVSPADGETVATESSPPAEATQGPPGPETARPVTLILGPGMARSLAAVGVLQVLNARGIRVSRLIGIEMGGVVASLYGATGKQSALEWDLMKLKLPETLSERSWVGKLLNPSSRKSAFRKNFEGARPGLAFETLRVPVSLLLIEPTGYTWAESGEVIGALEKAVFGENKQSDGSLSSADSARIIALVQSRFPDRRIWVGFAGEPGDADTWIEPDLKGIAADDFSKRNEIVFRGKQAAQAKLP